jgi:rubrerythrin
MKQPEGKPQWKCIDCGFILEAERPPEVCPSCKGHCEFKNVTCYLPDCGGPGNIDPRL